MRDMDAIKSDFAGRGVEFLAVNVFDEADAARSFVESSGYDFHWARAGEAAVERLGIQGVPAMIIVDGSGNVAWRSGLLTLFREGSDVRRALEDLASG